MHHQVLILMQKVYVASLRSGLSSVRRKGEFGAQLPLPGGFGGIIEFGEHRLGLWQPMERDRFNDCK